MVSRKNSIILVVLFCILITPAYAFTNPFTWVNDQFSFESRHDAYGEWAECISINSEEVCANKYCTVTSTNQIRCSYDAEAMRLFSTELYPGCNYDKEWNETEEVQFIYKVDFNSQDYALNKEICGDNGDFPRYFKKDSYRVPLELVSQAKSTPTWWEDFQGLNWLTSPTRAQMKSLYDEDFFTLSEGAYESLTEVDFNEEAFSVLSCQVDCDYEGVNDNSLDVAVCSDGQKDCAKTDFTKTTRFLSATAGLTYYNLFKDSYESYCTSKVLVFGNIYDQVKCIASYLNLEYRSEEFLGSRVYSEDVDMYTYEKYDSDESMVHQSFTCNYPKDTYSNQEVTARVRCVIGKTKEYRYFTKDKEEVSFSQIGLNNCDDSEDMCIITMDLSLYLNSTSGNFNYLNDSFEDYNRTLREIVDESILLTKPTLKYRLKDPRDVPNDLNEELNLQPIDGTVTKDVNFNLVTEYFVMFGEDIFAFLLIIVYLLEGFIFLAVVKLVFDSFMSLRQSYKALFGVNNKK